ncbi:L-threonylcarbamoyladenylate synthase [Hyphobacterium sp.]|jgi:L-threonylcarbamoyladenylate synthase|uniref:L-threonylcarbamoyladenylate synthase n=1 Tax=Hyphobacterium sp. TaxID=2004662 RepID=UPI003BAA43C8
MNRNRISPATADAITRAAEKLRAGQLVGMPTETVYGLAADATNGEAIARIYEAKNRPRFNPLIAHVSDLEMARQLVVFTPEAERLATAFWPGPLTLVLPRRPDCPVSELASAGLDTLAVRCPGHAVARSLIAATGRPLVAPSANPSGAISPTTAQHVADGLGNRVDIILDGGACSVGLESTVIGFDGETPLLLRKGGIGRQEIEAVAGRLGSPAPDAPKASPGMLASHYAPAASLRINAKSPRSGEVYLGFGPDWPADLNLSPTGRLDEAAANLFAYLRRLDASGARAIAVAPIPDKGLGEAINDRLRRAAAPRDLS